MSLNYLSVKSKRLFMYMSVYVCMFGYRKVYRRHTTIKSIFPHHFWGFDIKSSFTSYRDALKDWAKNQKWKTATNKNEVKKQHFDLDIFCSPNWSESFLRLAKSFSSRSIFPSPFLLTPFFFRKIQWDRRFFEKHLFFFLSFKLQAHSFASYFFFFFSPYIYFFFVYFFLFSFASCSFLKWLEKPGFCTYRKIYQGPSINYDYGIKLYHYARLRISNVRHIGIRFLKWLLWMFI